MAKQAKHSGVWLRSGEIAGGFLYLPFQMLLTAVTVELICSALDIALTIYQLNVTVFVINFIAVVAIFHRFLFDSLRQIGHGFWQFVQAVILAAVLYYALYYAVTWLYTLLKIAPRYANNDAIMTMLLEHRIPILICTCALTPVVEECIYRGLLFGVLREKNRILAYVVSMLVFALIHVWQAIGDFGLWNAALALITYLPAGLALAWAYEKGGTIWASILTHAIINFVVCYRSF